MGSEERKRSSLLVKALFLAGFSLCHSGFHGTRPVTRTGTAVAELPGQDISRIRSFSRLADHYRAEGRYDEALPLLIEALKIAEREFGPGHIEVARILNGLGVVCKYAGRF